MTQDSADLRRRLQVLEDKDEIRDLVMRYAYHARRAEGDPMGAMFTDDCMFETKSANGETSDILIYGREKLTAFYNSLTPGLTPLIHNLIIDFRGQDEARGTCMLENPSYADGGRAYIGYYEDEFLRVDGRWKFKSRVTFFLQGTSRPG